MRGTSVVVNYTGPVPSIWKASTFFKSIVILAIISTTMIMISSITFQLRAPPWVPLAVFTVEQRPLEL